MNALSNFSEQISTNGETLLKQQGQLAVQVLTQQSLACAALHCQFYLSNHFQAIPKDSKRAFLASVFLV